MIDPNELERLSKAAEKTEDDIRYYSGGSKYNEPLEQLKDQLVHLYRTGQLVPVQQPSGDVVEAVADAMRAYQANNRTWRMEDLALAAITAYESLRAKDTRP